MRYYRIYLRNVPDFYTWHSTVEIPLGSRVQVLFRNKKRIGIVIEATESSDFDTQEVLNILDESFLSEDYLSLAREVAQANFTKLAKVLSLQIPEPFLLKEVPEKYSRFYSLKLDFEKPQRQGPKQTEFLEWLKKNPFFEDQKVPQELKPVFKNFVSKGFLVCEQKKLIARKDFGSSDEPKKQNRLTALQKKALDRCIHSTKPVLLWGITGSGKTEIYKRFLAEKIGKDGQALMLVPEINLTPQLLSEFHQFFPGKAVVWHSNLTPQEKVQVWKQLQTGAAQILVGTRSACLVPLPKLKAIVVDEEHEWTYKNEFAPRFWTHDVVAILAKKFNAGLCFGTATPKLATFLQVQEAHFELVELKERIFGTNLPDIQIVDLKNEVKKGNFSPLSEKLVETLKATFEAGKQAVLFLNKRGWSGSLFCSACGHTFKCPNCDLPMKLHKSGKPTLLCHTCGKMEIFKEVCPECNNKDFSFKGWGTQQVEAVLKEHFPNRTILRADKDSITGKYDFEKLHAQFKDHKADILLGTQMVAKGLDFEKVQTVGVILADVGLNLPDYNTEERVFNLLEQVSGRAGRRHTQGKIIIQTYQDENPLLPT